MTQRPRVPEIAGTDLPVQVPPPRPRKRKTLLGMLGALIVVLVCLIYIANPTAGTIELIPDVIPIIGNLDEAGAGAALVFALSYLFRGRR